MIQDFGGNMLRIAHTLYKDLYESLWQFWLCVYRSEYVFEIHSDLFSREFPVFGKLI